MEEMVPCAGQPGMTDQTAVPQGRRVVAEVCEDLVVYLLGYSSTCHRTKAAGRTWGTKAFRQALVRLWRDSKLVAHPTARSHNRTTLSSGALYAECAERSWVNAAMQSCFEGGPGRNSEVCHCDDIQLDLCTLSFNTISSVHQTHFPATAMNDVSRAYDSPWRRRLGLQS